MGVEQKKINVVLLDKNVRFFDNESLAKALQCGLPILMLYVFPIRKNTLPNNEIHERFIKESLLDLDKELKYFNTKILCVRSEIANVLNVLQQFWKIEKIFTSAEAVPVKDIQRNKSLVRFCKNSLIKVIETGSRPDWFFETDHKIKMANAKEYLEDSVFRLIHSRHDFLVVEELKKVYTFFNPEDLSTKGGTIKLKGGFSMATQHLGNLIENKEEEFLSLIPYCTKNHIMSPYLYWGNISIRLIYQYKKLMDKDSICLDQFLNNYEWYFTFLAKTRMEKRTDVEPERYVHKKKISNFYFDQWRLGKTGYPMIDAIMRCLKLTAFIDYEMRKLTVFFLKKYLKLPISDGITYLNEHLIENTSGVFFSDIEDMMNRASDVKNDIVNYSKIIDPTGMFIKKFVPELQNLSKEYIHQPTNMSLSVQRENKIILGEAYPNPIV